MCLTFHTAMVSSAVQARVHIERSYLCYVLVSYTPTITFSQYNNSRPTPLTISLAKLGETAHNDIPILLYLAATVSLTVLFKLNRLWVGNKYTSTWLRCGLYSMLISLVKLYTGLHLCTAVIRYSYIPRYTMWDLTVSSLLNLYTLQYYITGLTLTFYIG